MTRTRAFLFALFAATASLVLMPVAQAQPPGSRPQLPLSYATWLHAKSDPAALSKLGAGLPGVAAEPGPHDNVVPATPTSGTWSNLVHSLGFNLSNPLVLTDGSVMVHRTDTREWYRLVPDSAGSYINGTWVATGLMPAGYGPKFHASAVLPDGRVIVEGGEYNLGGSASWSNLGAIYDPVSNTWASVTPPSGWTTIGDAQSAVLANKTYFLADCCSTKTALFNASTLGWTATGTGKADWNDEESWTLLQDDRVLTVDAYVNSGTCGRNTESYNPSTGAWTTAGLTPDILSDCGVGQTYEIGPQVGMMNGVAIAFGGNTVGVTHVALYSGSTWSAAPNLPQSCGASSNLFCTLADAPATLMSNGRVLFVASPGAFNPPAKFFEYDGTSYAVVAGTSDASSITSFYVNFVMLPNGQIFSVETYTSVNQIYTPVGTYQAAWRPVVSSISSSTLTSGSTYTISGTQFNGLSQGSNYGDDQQGATNYPLVRITNNSTGHVFYARTSGHSTMRIAPGTSGSTSFKVPAGIEAGASSLVVVANGIPSTAQSVTIVSNVAAHQAPGKFATCYTCGGDWPAFGGALYFSGSPHSQSYEYGAGCSGSQAWNATDTSPYLCTN